MDINSAKSGGARRAAENATRLEHRMKLRGYSVVLLMVCSLAPLAVAQSGHSNLNASPTNEQYVPRLGDIMNAVQTRHIKLWFAGKAQNWDLAAYELDELRDTFDGVGKLILKHGQLSIPQAIAATVKQPLDALAAAIKAKDSPGFVKAYADLTAGCNACHQSAGHPMIVMQVPTVSGTAFPDQDFSPKK